jgi:ABC-type xylose transport system substrate-binding protein
MCRVLLACCLLVLSLSACTSLNPTVIAVLVADQSAELQQPLDLDALESRVEELCEGCAVKVYDAESDADTQSDQLDQALAASADVVILDAVDPELAESLVQRTGEVPVLAVGTLVPGSDLFVGLTEPVDPPEGADSDLEAAREVILRDRKSFTFVPAAQISTRAAEVAVGELVGKPVDGSVDTEGVPSWLFEPVEVNVQDLTSIVVAAGALTLEELCSGDTAERCGKLGLV